MSDFLKFKKSDLPNFAVFYTFKCIFGGGCASQLRWHIPGEGGWDTDVGRSSSI
jgi:hypothetical protein